MRLNLGCGYRKLQGWTNIDAAAACQPDHVVDLEMLPWPWADDSVDEVLLCHVLEHLGQQTAVYLGIMKELYRVCRDGATITIVVPHPRHETFLGDPTHVRPITLNSLALFSQERNREWIAQGAGNTPLGLYIGVDFVIERATYELDAIWQRRLNSGEITAAEAEYAERTYNNVATQNTIVMRAVKS